MNFVKTLQEQINDPIRSRGRQCEVTVSHRALRELLMHFEELDSYCRATHPETRSRDINNQLAYTIEAAYQQQGKSSERTLMLIMDTLRPLMEKRHKDRQITQYLRR